MAGEEGGLQGARCLWHCPAHGRKAQAPLSQFPTAVQSQPRPLLSKLPHNMLSHLSITPRAASPLSSVHGEADG